MQPFLTVKTRKLLSLCLYDEILSYGMKQIGFLKGLQNYPHRLKGYYYVPEDRTMPDEN